LNNGSSVPQINNKDIEPLIIPIPPIELQNRFADIVKQIDKQKFEIENSLKEMQELYESLMEKYFG
jgi:restriction endonuclease S subunit